jgi:hypothetical protein
MLVTKKWLVVLVVFTFAFVSAAVSFSASAFEDSAEDLYADYKEVLYQIKIIDNESGQKSTIGSGFIIGSDGLAVTNYHVVSKYILHPDENHIEVENIDGEITDAQLVSFDVVNDLALINIDLENEAPKFLSLATELPIQGSTIYSLGNPHDLGMIVVPGTYNGIKKDSFYETIHFTGSVNSGMSGGPVINEDGQVMGVNVASAGNQLGFLVPLDKLQMLVEDTSTINKERYKDLIAEQLTRNQNKLIDELTAETWPSTPLGLANVPDAMTDFINCWGDSNSDDDDAQFLAVRKSCSLGQTIYVSDRIRSGEVSTNFKWYASEKLNSFRFYELIASRAKMTGDANWPKKDDFSEYQCQLDTVENINKVTFKAATCIKAYKEFSGLFDVIYVSATLDQKNASLVSNFRLSGITQASFEKFTPLFMDAIKWQ